MPAKSCDCALFYNWRFPALNPRQTQGRPTLSGRVARESTTPNNALATAGARTVATLAAIRPGTFVKRLVSWVFLWVATLFLIYSNWRTPSLISIGLLALLGQWEFYRAQEEKGHKVFKQSGLFCGALIFCQYLVLS